MTAKYSDFDDDDILPEACIFDNRADDIWNTKMEAYEELFHKNQIKEEEEALESEKKDLLLNIAENQKAKSKRGKKGKKAVTPVVDYNPPAKMPIRTSQRNKKCRTDDQSEDVKDKEVVSPETIKLSASAKKRLKKLQMETERQQQRVDEETRRILSACNTNQDTISVDFELIEDDLAEQDIVLKIRYMSRISKITVGKQEVFKSIFKKVADIFQLEPTEILLCLGDKNIGLNDTPQSIKIRSFEIIDCFPYKPETVSEDDTNKLLLKIQSNDTRKKTEIYTHKLEKLEEVMKKYADLRKISLKDLIFEFDGEKLDGSETPADLDMESGSCVDVIVLNYKKPPPKNQPKVNIEQIPQSEMLDICVLD